MIYSHTNNLNTSHFQLKYFFEKCPESVPVMQFTGLLDKNGKEIYEGDILKCVAKMPEREGQIFNNVVYWLKYRFRLKNNRFSADLTPNRIYNASAEIIGDIYQNPNLLK